MQQHSTEQLGTERVGKLFLKLAVPAITAQVINLLYNLVDRMYIGHIEGYGRTALTGVGVTLPMILLISAFAALVSMGGAPMASISLGKGDHEGAERILGNCFSLQIVVSLVLTGVFLAFGKSMLWIFGASNETIGYAWEYMSVYSMGTLFVQLTLGMNAFISAQGFAGMSMLTVVIGAVCNIVLDPIFIFVFDMGVAGAAWATILSQAVSAVWVVWFLNGKKTTLKIRKKYLWLRAKVILPCIALGLSPFIMQATESVIAVCFNESLQRYGGDLAVGAMTILSSVMQFSMLPLHGLTQGAQPVVSYNFGAHNAGRVKAAFKVLLISCLSYSFVLWALAMIAPQLFVLIFNDDTELLEYTCRALRIYMAVSCVFGAQIACQQTFIAIGNAKSSLFLAVFRKIILLIPLIYILPAILPDKATAVFIAEPAADLIAVFTTVTMFTIQFKKALRKIENPQ